MEFTGVHNYYERLVIELIMKAVHEGALVADPDYLGDVACLALNHLPPRYIRHDVDMAFYLSTQERAEMEQHISDAVRYAVDYIAQYSSAQQV